MKTPAGHASTLGGAIGCLQRSTIGPVLGFFVHVHNSGNGVKFAEKRRESRPGKGRGSVWKFSRQFFAFCLPLAYRLNHGGASVRVKIR
jgi:hypothetical protein